jgi:sugar phosphate isomerase/epimerase
LRIGCCGGADQVELFSRLGFDYIEPPVVAVAEAEDYSRLAKSTEKYDLKPEVFNCFLPASLPVVGPDVDQPAICKYLNKVLPRIESLGGRIVVFGSGKARNNPKGFPVETAKGQLLIFLDMAAEAAGDRVRIVIEPLNQKQTNLLNQVAETRKICQKMGWRVGLLADLFHMARENEPLENLFPVWQLSHVHVPLPEKSFALDSFLGLLKARGYTRRVSLEDNGGLARTQDRERVLEQALEYVRSIN